jgi:hypothetical protein
LSPQSQTQGVAAFSRDKKDQAQSTTSLPQAVTLVLRHEGKAPPQQRVFRLGCLLFSLLQKVRTLRRSERATFDFSIPETHARHQRPFSIQVLSQMQAKSAVPDRGTPLIENDFIA